jgi:penicillin G amidase
MSVTEEPQTSRHADSPPPLPPPRRRAWRKLRWALAALVLLVVVASGIAAALYYRMTRGALPQTTGRIAVAGIANDVDVLRDTGGTPHVLASTVEDVYFTQGYVTAQDRMWEMDLLRRGAAGELSEIVGERGFSADKNQRLLGFRRVASRSFDALEPEMRASLESYARGVNAYIDENRGSLPFEFQLLRYEPRPWTPVDSLLIGKLMAQTLGTTWQRDLMRAHFADLDRETFDALFVETSRYDVPFVGADAAEPRRTSPVRKPAVAAAPPRQRVDSEARAALEPAVSAALGESGPAIDWVLAMLEPSHDEAPNGSNNWVVGGALTATGKPLLANDPHLSLDIPPIWYATHLTLADGSLDVAGVTIPGIPGIIIGRTPDVAWGVTNFNPDVQDLYAEEFDAQGKRYKVGDQWYDAELRTEAIVVRKDPLRTETETRTTTVIVTRHGPIVSDQGRTKYALRWTALEPGSEMPAFYLLDRARSWDDFRAALSRYPGPMQNFVFADTKNNIGYYAAGMIPIRRSGDGAVPYDGAGNSGDWIGYVPFTELPHVFNPPEGFVVTANNRVLGTSAERFYTHEWMAPFRARRITELIRARTALTAADMAAIQGDVYSYPDAIFAREVLAVAKTHADDPGEAGSEWKRLASHLEGWDGRLTIDSTAAGLVVTMRDLFNSRVLRGKLEGRAGQYSWFNREAFYANIVENRPASWLPSDAPSWDTVILDAYREARKSLSARLGPDQAAWRYGKLNEFQFVHNLGEVPGLASLVNPSPFEMDGGPNTVKAILASLGPLRRKWGSSMRFVADLSDADRTTLNLPTGQSGQHASEHYIDQIDDWRFVRPRAFPFTRNAVRATTASSLLLTPTRRPA